MTRPYSPKSEQQSPAVCMAPSCCLRQGHFRDSFDPELTLLSATWALAGIWSVASHSRRKVAVLVTEWPAHQTPMGQGEWLESTYNPLKGPAAWN